jgi:hypothetical protein
MLNVGKFIDDMRKLGPIVFEGNMDVCPPSIVVPYTIEDKDVLDWMGSIMDPVRENSYLTERILDKVNEELYVFRIQAMSKIYSPELPQLLQNRIFEHLRRSAYIYNGRDSTKGLYTVSNVSVTGDEQRNSMYYRIELQVSDALKGFDNVNILKSTDEFISAESGVDEYVDEEDEPVSLKEVPYILRVIASLYHYKLTNEDTVLVWNHLYERFSYILEDVTSDNYLCEMVPDELSYNQFLSGLKAVLSWHFKEKELQQFFTSIKNAVIFRHNYELGYIPEEVE